MKKYLLISILSVFGLTTAHAQYNDQVELGIFDNMSVGLGLGTTGISLDVAAPITPLLAVRLGADIVPKITIHPALDLGITKDIQEISMDLIGERLPDKIDFDGKIKFAAGHLLVDIYPFKKSSFHVTAGAYLGGKEIGNLNTAGDQILLKAIYEYNKAIELVDPDLKVGVKLGNYFLEPNKDGVIKTSLEVNALRPYIGIGFGRAVPTKHRFACNFDLGFQFWGTPKIYLEGDNGKKHLDKSDLAPESAKALKKLSETTFWPVLNVRCAFRLFK